jgi:hypothetical protein
MSPSFSTALKKYIASRADYRCEYCKKPDIIANFSFHIEHIISHQHGGQNHISNLAYACSWCNWKKGPNIATILNDKGILLPLFHPRNDAWLDHFMITDGIITGKTDIATGTIRLLDMNTPELIMERVELTAAGYF